MTIVKNHKEYKIGGKIYFVEQYWEKELQSDVYMWRYGEIYYTERRMGRVISDMMRSRPNLKRLNL
jgi:hypothetical protein